MLKNYHLLLLGILHKMKMVNKPIFHWLRKGFWLGCCSNKRKRIDRKPQISSLWKHHINHKILHRNIEHLFNSRLQPMHLINKKDISIFQAIKYTYEFTWLGKSISSDDFDLRSQLLGNNTRHSRFSETTRSRKQNMSKLTLPFLCTIYSSSKNCLYRVLSYKLRKTSRSLAQQNRSIGLK